MKRTVAAWVALFLLWTGLAWALTPPDLTGRVVDLAGVIEDGQKTEIIGMLKAHENATTQQFAVLILPSLEGEVLEEFSMRTVEKWQLGTAEDDNGLLILVAMAERKMRIEVGYGLEGTIPDAMAKRVIDEVMQPAFREGQFGEGITLALISLIQLSEGETPDFDYTPSDGEQLFGLVMGHLFAWGFAIFYVVFLFAFLRNLGNLVRGRPVKGFGSSLLSGGGGGGGGFSGGGGSFGGGGASGGW